MELLLYGLVHSAALLLTAFGFCLTYGISRVPNFAHGALYVLGGYVAWLAHVRLGLPYPLAALVAVATTAAVSWSVHRWLLRRIRGLETSEVIATWAIGLALLEGMRWAGLRGSTFALPPWLDGISFPFDVPLEHQRIAVAGAAVVVLAGAASWTRFTRAGRALRAVAQDEQAAMLSGIDVDRRAGLAMALGGALAAIAALSIVPLGSLVVDEGYKVLIASVAVCVVGGLGSWSGTVAAALVIGFAQYAAVAYGQPQYQSVVVLVAMILTLLVRPSGLLGRQRALEDRV